ncbi:uncharacterized protein Dyak_GE27590, partial [Drosophila yakuba]
NWTWTWRTSDISALVKSVNKNCFNKYKYPQITGLKMVTFRVFS